MDVVSQQRGKNIAIAGAASQLVFAAVLFAIFVFTKSIAVLAATGLLGGGVMLCAAAAVLFYVRQLERQEALEIEQLAGDQRAGGTIFEGPGHDGVLHPAARRREWFERWLAPAFTLLWAGFHVAFGQWILRRALISPDMMQVETSQPILFTVGVGFLVFLFSRYATGMGSGAEYRPLRACGSYLLLTVLAMLGAVAAMVAGYRGSGQVDQVVGFALPAVQFVLAVELIINFIMELYRPRVPGQEPRLSFDSRLLGLMAEPGRMGHSIAETVNYQFGFEVSRTWFYKLLSRAMVPLLVSGVVIMLGLTCIVVMPAGERGVVFRLGRMNEQVMSPGIHLKLPWPIETVERHNVEKVYTMRLGEGERRGQHPEQDPTLVNFAGSRRELLLWDQQHGRHEEFDFLVAVKPRDQRDIPAVNIIKLVAMVNYVIDPDDPEALTKFAYKYTDAQLMLENLAYREMVDYMARSTLSEPLAGGADRPQAIMNTGREQAARGLMRRIQAAADEADLGVRITYVGLPSVHPPAAAAPAYQEVLAAERLQDKQRFDAEADANRMLAEAAGDPATARHLLLAIRRLQEFETLQTRHDPEEFAQRLSDYIASMNADIDVLADDIDQQRKQGRIREGSALTESQKLIEAYQAHLAELKSLAAAAADAPELVSQIIAARGDVNTLFDQAAGEPATLIALAWADRWSNELAERARSESFQREVLAYKASPNLYMMDRLLEVLDDVLPQVNKYVLGIDPEQVEFLLNLERDNDPFGQTNFGQSDAR